MWRPATTFLVATVIAVLATGCELGEAFIDYRCSSSDECTRSRVCRDRRCVEQACATSLECAATVEVCSSGQILGKDSAESFCTAAECAADGSVSCFPGKTCSDGICVPTGS